MADGSAEQRLTGDALITSEDPNHPANLIPSLCAKFWTLGWVTGTGGGCSIRDEYVFYPLVLLVFTFEISSCLLPRHPAMMSWGSKNLDILPSPFIT
jgi:ribulose-5-phosphate 4-epimerase/fuculose-1-phosphate aldolase